MRALVFDSETTDLVHNALMPLNKQPHIIEWSGILADISDTGAITEVRRLDQLIRPPHTITELTTKLTNITNEMVATMPTWREASADIIAIIEEADAFVGQNLMFDVQVTEVEMERICPGWKFPEQQARHCTVEIHEFPLGRRYKLGDLHAHYFGAPHASAHRAMADVEATLKCFGKAIEMGYV